MSDKRFGSSAGLTIIGDAGTAFVSSEFNSGYMSGDIKLATLSDTDATDVTGSELVTNGTFDSDTSGWQSASGGILNATGGNLVVSGNSGDAAYAAAYPMTLEIGKQYIFSVDVVSFTQGADIRLGKVLTGTEYEHINEASVSAGTTYTISFTATTTSSFWITLYGFGDGGSASFDNVSLVEAEEDRSANGNGLQVFGTVTKTPVATGADLVAYSGFSGSNYLEQPYNSDLDFGTGDFCVMGWVKAVADSYQVVLDRSNPTDENSKVAIVLNNLSPYLEVRDSSNNGDNTGPAGTAMASNVWNFLAGVRRNGVIQMYLNGNAINSPVSCTRDVTNSSVITRVGVTTTGVAPMDNGSLALLRISGTAPTAEQIKRIYEDEKVLFQEGAKSVLAGTSDAVTALAYDEDTSELLVGTSQYTSVFSGLRRVEEISGSASAISASNGMRAIED